MDQPVARFAIGALLGLLASFSISFGLVLVIAAFAAVVLVGIAWRSHAALSGGLCAFGLTWLVLIGSTYMNCVSMGPNCAGSENMVPFLIIAAVVFVAGLAAGLLGIVRDRASRYGIKRSAA